MAATHGDATPASIPVVSLLVRGAAAGLAAGAALAVTVMLIAEIASEPTFAPAIDSSTWTPLTGVAAALLGPDSFHGGFEPLPILFGAGVLLAVYAPLGAAGVALMVWALGPRPSAHAALVLGVVYGLLVQIALVNAAVNQAQDEQTVYESLPQWGWWAGHAAFGAVLGLVAAGLLRRLSGPRPAAAFESRARG